MTKAPENKKLQPKKKKTTKSAFSAFFSHWGSSIFYIGIALFIFAAIIVINTLQGSVRDYLSEYENSQPRYTVQSIFREYFEEPDFDYLLDQSGYTVSSFNSKSELVKYFNERIKGKTITYVYVAGTEKTKINVKADGEKFASFSIKKSGQTTEHGFEMYVLDKINTYFMADLSVQATVPSACRVEVNGITLDGQYRTVTAATDDTRDTIPEGTYKHTYDTYRVTGLLDEPSLRIFGADGEELEPLYDSEKREYSLGYTYSEELQAEYSDYVITATEQYAARIQNAISFSGASKYFEKGTKLYTYIKENPASFVWPYDDYEYSDESADKFYSYDKDTFSCNVKVTHILHKRNRPDDFDYIGLTLYLRRGDDGVFRIYDMETN